MASNKAVFFDRDGTLIVDKHYLSNPDDVELIDSAKESLRAILDKGYLLFVHTNQSGIGRGFYTLDDATACNKRMLDLLELPEHSFVDICIAPETPDEAPVYRKPSPKFFNEMVQAHSLDPKQCWVVGDKSIDLEAGINAGMNIAWVATGKAKTDAVSTHLKEHNGLELQQMRDLLPYLS